MTNLCFILGVITTVALLAIAGVVFYKHPEVDLLLYLSLVRYTLVQSLTFLLPLALLIAVVFVYGRAAADHEITTLKASGIHPYRMIWPGALLAIVLGAISFESENRWSPWALHQLRVLPQQEGTLKALLEKRIASGERSVDFGDKRSRRKLFWESIRVLEGGGVELARVLLETTEVPEQVVVPGAPPEPPPAPVTTHVRADRAVARFDAQNERVVLRLEKARGLSGVVKDANQEAMVVTIELDRDEERARLKLQALPELIALRARALETSPLSGQSLLRKFDLVEVEGRIHQRFARAATPLVFLLLGIPLALVFRSGNRLIAFLLASLIGLFVYYPTERLANVLMSRELVAPVVACWSGNLLLAAIGTGLLVFVVRR